MSDKKRVLYFYPILSSFSRKDLVILQNNYSVKPFHFDAIPKSKTPFAFIKQFFFLCANIFSADILIVQFGGYQSFLPALFGKLFGKPCLLVLGGTDCFSFPSINYGNFNKKILGAFTCMSYRLCSHISTVHETLVKGDYSYNGNTESQQGYLHFCPKTKAPNTTLYYGYDPEKISAKGSVKTPKTFFTAGFDIEGTTFFRKGIDLILAVAPSLPDCNFTVVGCNNPSKFKDVPKNVKLLPPVNYEQLIQLYSTQQYYLQISIAEGFPSAVCEAMLCECVPLGSNVAAIPMIIGDCGFILEKRDKDQFLALIQKALLADTASLGQKARQRIKTMFPPEKREHQLVELVETLMK